MARLQGGELLHRLDGRAVGSEDLHAEEEADGVFLELQHHGFEHVEGFLLVGHQRILLRIAAQADAFLQVIHGEQVIFPEAVDHAEHDHALVVAHLAARRGSAPSTRSCSLELLEDRVAQFVAREFLAALMPACGEAEAELADELLVHALDVPLVGVLVFGGEFVEDAGEDSADVVFER